MVTFGLLLAAASFILGILLVVGTTGSNITMGGGRPGSITIAVLLLCTAGVVVGLVLAAVGALLHAFG